MAKTQTITFKKTGSDWVTWNEALDELLIAVDATTPSTADIVGAAQGFTGEFQMDEETQELQEIRTFLVDSDYDDYKSNMTSQETTVNDELKAAGWEITDTVE
tara:strand:- start:529 stop:837 length:309 start_codon:yes stop_codon:yes gene_type:complete